MKKVLLRLLVAGIILALVVVILMNTVFKTESSLKTHDDIAKAISPNGQITKLYQMLEDDEVESQFPNIVYIISSETETLKEFYPMIKVTKENSDKKTETMLKSLEALESNLKKANTKFENIKNSQSTGDVKQRMVEDLEEVLIKSMDCLQDLNKALMEYLVQYYYGKSYDTNIALHYIKVAYAQNYFDDDSISNLQLYQDITVKCKDANYILQLSKDKDFNTLLFNCKSVNIYKIITDENYITSLDEGKQAKANQIATCLQSVVQINN
ncbi:MAG: hypothetical protein IJZ29_05685 [Clostridia bacterium]|nr:hypothetical protein [Clostridia bacterium]